MYSPLSLPYLSSLASPSLPPLPPLLPLPLSLPYLSSLASPSLPPLPPLLPLPLSLSLFLSYLSLPPPFLLSPSLPPLLPLFLQVTGELSISGRPMRAFVQTFVLAPESPKKYYVHNDIFRYQDDDLVSESETNEGPG